MNRPIKFRLWNTITHRLHYPKNAALLFNDISWTFDGSDDVPLRIPEGWYRYGDDQDSILQQYVGLKDKHGKEIYEGDILKCKLFNGWFDVDGYYSNVEVKYSTSNHGESSQSGYLIPLDREVIGNIFQNPELLKT